MKFISVDVPYVKQEYFDQIAGLKGVESVLIAKDNPDSPEEIVERIGDAELLTSDFFLQLDKQVLESAPNLKAIFCQAVGFDNVDIDYAKKKGIKVFNAAGYNASAVSEFVFALITSLLRKIPAAQAHVRAGGWDYRLFEGSELLGKTIGIIGSGNVGQKIARIANGYGMNVMSHTKHSTKEKAKLMGISSFDSLLDVMKKSDIVVLSVPLTEETKHLIKKNELSVMKKTAILVNVARHTVVDEYALAEAIVNGNIAGAVLDMMISEPFYLKSQPIVIQEMVNMPNVIVTPHIGGVTEEGSIHLGEIFVENVKEFLSGGNNNCVNC